MGGFVSSYGGMCVGGEGFLVRGIGFVSSIRVRMRRAIGLLARNWVRFVNCEADAEERGAPGANWVRFVAAGRAVACPPCSSRVGRLPGMHIEDSTGPGGRPLGAWQWSIKVVVMAARVIAGRAASPAPVQRGCRIPASGIGR
jgi:hypothetical protein